jgi:hypothetical protein
VEFTRSAAEIRAKDYYLDSKEVSVDLFVAKKAT